MLPRYAKRLRLEAQDRLRYHPLVRRLLRRVQLWRDRPPAADDPQAVARSIARLCAAARLAEGEPAEWRILERIRERVARLDESRLDWKEFQPEIDVPRVAKAVVLKPYLGPRERGVVYISFEMEWVKLLRIRDRDEFARRYAVIVAPSGSPHNLVNYVFPAAFPAPVFTQISNPHDEEVLPRISERLFVVPLYASHWVNPALFRPVPRGERPYDLIMVAAFGPYKRHHVLFAALRRMPKDLRVLLIGQDHGDRTAETIREVARWYGVEDRFTLLANQSYAAVTQAFCQARASIILSRREGSCVAVAESLMADAPAAVLAGAELGSRVFLNDQTGRMLREADLARELTAFVREADRFHPRHWAEANISCWRSSEVLNDVLRRQALARGEAWTQDLAAMQWSPDPRHARPEDAERLAPERRTICEQFGLDVGPTI